MKLRFVSTKQNVFEAKQIHYIDVLPLTYHYNGCQYMKLNKRQMRKVRSFLMKYYGYTFVSACYAIDKNCMTKATLVKALPNCWVYKL